ncbi:hypothetical protein CQ040_15855 [Microbacterium sp. MYb54]|nr:hypothetical protein CQ032_15205 [Microbacterium sp. MYb43]PQZ75110.1 hypothetical protein CQ031_14555 [Microbacterium sp. MYb40]PRB19405.1 hypothetical protein CQ040_15855 [Microbacterium sp. MYb54]PRB24606.1 hypothetical protein CQ037_16360 [Microbacterium sp. MYb50]PRB63717.1 hypothetical protein CQ021_15965 [Microbacterium sp. MYb24]PRB69151.1 hypothetical protein CQ027_17265 [Microbacterium sp. MYb32]
MRSVLVVVPTFTLLGLFSSLTPRFIHDSLHIDNLAIAGAATFVLFVVGTVAQLIFRGRESRTLVLVGLPLLAASLGLVLSGLLATNLLAFSLGTITGGVGAGMAFMGGLAQLVDAVPHETHARSVAAYFIAAQSGLAIPVLTIGVLAPIITLQTATVIVVAGVVALAAVAFSANLRAPQR